MNVTVADTTAPAITAPAGVSTTTGVGARSCTVFISDADLGTASASDLCSSDVNVTRSGVPSGNLFPVGTTTITYTARDAAGNEATAEQTVTVADTTSPSIANLSVTPNRLWPANHQMVDVFVSYSASDGCDDSAIVSVSVESSDAANARGDVTTPDWVIVDPHHIQLRAERAPGSAERVYTISVTARDAAGNESTRPVTVVVAPPNSSRR